MESCSKNARFFEEKVTEHYDYLQKFLMTATKDHTLASDLTQETMAAAWEKIHHLCKYSNIKHALLRMAKNKLYDHWKKNKPRRTFISFPEICGKLITEEDGLLRLIKREERRILLGAIGDLSEEYMQVIFLRYYYGQSLRDVAKMTDTNYSTVLSRHRRALQALEKLLEKAK